MNHLLKRGSIFAVCLLTAASVFGQVAGPIKAISVPGKPAGPVSSSGILTGKTLYIAAQDGRNADGSVPTDFQQEASQSLANVQGVLHAAGMDFGNAAWMIVYLTHPADIDKMNDVYWKMIGSNPPARTVLFIGALPNGANIQINCIAVSSEARRQVIHVPGWPMGPHIDPPGIQEDDVLYISAQAGIDHTTGKLVTDPAGEVKQSLDNVASVLKAANMTMANVVWTNPFLDANTQEMNKEYATRFEFGNTPGRGTTQVAGLPDGEHVVFSVIAGANLARWKSIQTINMAPSPTASPGVLYDDTLYLSGKSPSWEMPLGGGGGAGARRAGGAAGAAGGGAAPAAGGRAGRRGGAGGGAAGAAGGGAAARGGRGGEPTPDIDTSVRISLRNLYDGLLVANMNFGGVVWNVDYLRDIKDADAVQNATAPYWNPEHMPARTTFQQTANTTGGGSEQISTISVLVPKQ